MRLRRFDSLDLGALLVIAASVPALAFAATPFSRDAVGGSVLLAAAILAGAAQRRLCFIVAVALPFLMSTADLANQLVVWLTPHTADAAMLRLDHGLSVAVWHWAGRHAAIRWVLVQVYVSILFLGAAVVLLSPEKLRYLRAFAAMSLAGPFFYLLCPAVGPAHVGDPAAYRNCMPSIHFASALLFVRFAGRWRGWFAGYAALMALATLGLGEHYLLDLAAAVPFAWAICWLERRIW